MNACETAGEARASCVSSQNDDAERFVNPWAHEYGKREDAMRALVETATGKTAIRGRAGPRAGGTAAAGRLSFDARVEACDEDTGYVRLLLVPRGDDESKDASRAFDA